MIEIRVETVIGVEPMAVWAVLTDHENMHKWTSFHKVVRVRPGSAEPDGVGAVRRLHAIGRVMEERITRFEPRRCLEYDVLTGAPGWTPRGQITLTPMSARGTLVCWTVTMHPYLPRLGWLIKVLLQRSLSQSLERLKQRLEPELLLALEKTDRVAAERAPVASRPRRVAATRPRVARESTSGA